jgi:AhpD family alkylhydroperoxidase
MALVIAVVKEFDGCIAYHAKAAALKGATSEAVAEALSVALLMDGGRRRSPPSTGWSSDSRL